MKFIKSNIKLLVFICFCYESLQYSLRNKANTNIPIEVPTIYKMSTIKPIIPLSTDYMKKIFKKTNGPIFVNITKKLSTATNNTKKEQMKEKIKELEEKLVVYEKEIKELKHNQTRNNNNTKEDKVSLQDNNNTSIKTTADVQNNTIKNETYPIDSNTTIYDKKTPQISNNTDKQQIEKDKNNYNISNNINTQKESNITETNSTKENNTVIDNPIEKVDQVKSKGTEEQVEASLESELESSIGARKESNSNSLSSFIQKDMYTPNPCYNKGYYSKEKKIIGEGNYSLCYLSHTSNKNQSSMYSMNYTLSSQTERELITHLVNNRETPIRYESLISHIDSVCNMNYSSLLNHYSNESNIDTLCLNLTLFTIYVESYHQVTNNSFIFLKENIPKKEEVSNSKYNLQNHQDTFKTNIIVSIISNNKIKNTLYLFLISLAIAAITYISKQNLINSFISLYSNRINTKVVSYSFVKDQLTYQNVKYYLFYSESSIFKTKYGKDFKYNSNCEKEIILEIISISSTDKNLIELMKNNSITNFRWKISFSFYILFILEIIITCSSFCFLLYNIYSEFGLKYIFTMYLTFNVFCIALLVLLYVCIQLRNEGNRKL